MSKSVGGRKSIYFDGILKQCASCEEKLPLTEFHPSGNAQEPNQSGFYKSMCNSCISKYNNKKQKEKRYAQNPEKYWRCDCGGIVSNVYDSCYNCTEEG
jgi:hypothetical protein